MIIAITNHKGGVGKTTIAMNLGLALASRGNRVVMVDADAQGTLTEGLGFQQSPGLYDILVRGTAFVDVIATIPGEKFDAEENGGWAGAILGNNETRHVAESVSDAKLVLERFRLLAETVDYIIFDMPPTESLLHPIVYIACDAVIHPVICESWAVASLRRTMQYVARSQAYRAGIGLIETRTLGIIPNLYRDTNIHQIFCEQLREEFNGLVQRPIRQRIVWSEAAAFNQPVFVYDKNSEATADLWSLADLVEGK